MSAPPAKADTHRQYVGLILALAVVTTLGLFAYGVYLQPLWGDLTRLGPYAERDFGWNKPQLEFHRALSQSGGYNRYFDMVVLGDSFSIGRPLLNWQNYVAASTNWSIVTIDAKEATPDQILANPVFRETPPRIFIFESVERELPLKLKSRPPCRATSKPRRIKSPAALPSQTAPAYTSNLEHLANYVERGNSLAEIRLEYVISYLRNNVLRNFSIDVNSNAVDLDLHELAPFSSSNNRKLLVFLDDFQKTAWWRDMGVADMACRINEMREQFEAAGHTRFVLMVAPDKLTAYGDFVRNRGESGTSSLSGLAERLGEITPRIDLALKSAIRHGAKDVYLPDDTHWGSAGYQVVAETLLDFLRQNQGR